MTDPSPDTQQIEMLKTLLHDSRTERTRLADEVDRLRALADPAPVGLSQEDRELVEEIRNGTYGRPVGHVEALLAIIDRLSPSTEENVCGSCGKNHSEDPLCTN